jgi:hypothetical protein
VMFAAPEAARSSDRGRRGGPGAGGRRGGPGAGGRAGGGRRPAPRPVTP